MKKVRYIITSASIQPSFDGKDIYDSYDLVSRGLRDAPLVENASVELAELKLPFLLQDVLTIFTAPRGQTYETAKLIVQVYNLPSVQIISLDELRGIRFSMKQLISRDEFLSMPYEKAIVKARQQFIRKLFNNELEESFDSVKKRILTVLSILGNSEGNVLCISHGFFMKLIEVFTLMPEAFESVSQLEQAFNPKQKPFGFLEGFCLKCLP